MSTPQFSRFASLRIRVWDLPTRIAHWLLVALLAFSWWTAESRQMQWHLWSGYTLLCVVLFRVYWGFAGATTARFREFVRGPRAFWTYARTITGRSGPVTAGHNPMGGWSVAAMLVLLLMQPLIGLFVVDIDGIDSGPLSDLVSFDTGRLLAGWHEVIFNLLLALVALHIAAILFYRIYKREQLLSAMFTGWKQVSDTTPRQAQFVPAWRAILGVILAIAITVAIVTRFRF